MSQHFVQAINMTFFWSIIKRNLLGFIRDGGDRGTLTAELRLKAQCWTELGWAFTTPMGGSSQTISRIQKHIEHCFKKLIFCSQEKSSLIINSSHVQNRYQEINSAYFFSSTCRASSGLWIEPEDKADAEGKNARSHLHSRQENCGKGRIKYYCKLTTVGK